MKKHTVLCALALTLSAGLSVSALADDTAAPAGKCKDHKHKHHGFSEGLCIGQALAQQGIVLPARVAGQRPTFDAATKAAFEAAKASCRTQGK
jgi:hypothetical protein